MRFNLAFKRLSLQTQAHKTYCLIPFFAGILTRTWFIIRLYVHYLSFLAFSLLFVRGGAVCLLLCHFKIYLTFVIMWCVEYCDIRQHRFAVLGRTVNSTETFCCLIQLLTEKGVIYFGFEIRLIYVVGWKNRSVLFGIEKMQFILSCRIFLLNIILSEFFISFFIFLFLPSHFINFCALLKALLQDLQLLL